MFALKDLGIEVIRLPIIIQGGNVVLAKDISGRKLVFVGFDDLYLTRFFYNNVVGNPVSDLDEFFKV